MGEPWRVHAHRALVHVAYYGRRDVRNRRPASSFCSQLRCSWSAVAGAQGSTGAANGWGRFWGGLHVYTATRGRSPRGLRSVGGHHGRRTEAEEEGSKEVERSVLITK